jgi:hypothetical protein
MSDPRIVIQTMSNIWLGPDEGPTYQEDCQLRVFPFHIVDTGYFTTPSLFCFDIFA